MSTRVNFERYEAMGRVHPPEIVRQRLMVDLQIRETTEEVEQLVASVCNRETIPENLKKQVYSTNFIGRVPFSRYEAMGKIHPPEVVRQRVLVDLQIRQENELVQELVESVCSGKAISEELKTKFQCISNLSNNTPAKIVFRSPRLLSHRRAEEYRKVARQERAEQLENRETSSSQVKKACAAYEKDIFETYLSMGRVHPPAVVRQRIMVDLQVKESNQNIEKLVQIVCNSENIPEELKLAVNTSRLRNLPIDQYEAMGRVHPPEIVRQRISVDLEKLQVPYSKHAVEKLLGAIFSDEPISEKHRKELLAEFPVGVASEQKWEGLTHPFIYFSRYEGMGRVHPPEIVRQRILTDLQMRETNDHIEKLVECVCNGETVSKELKERVQNSVASSSPN